MRSLERFSTRAAPTIGTKSSVKLTHIVFAVVVGNHGESEELWPITLADFLKKTGHYAACTGVNRDSKLYDEQLDSEISIRFQTTFLPVKDDADNLSTLEFCTEAYNYNTRQDDDPRNAILLCTTQGVAFQQDGTGAKKLFHHAVDAKGTVHRYWLEAEQSRHKVGGAQTESKDEAMLAAARGKSTASVIGIEAMGARFNVLMTVQVPLQQKPKPKRINRGGGGGMDGFCCGSPSYSDDGMDGCCPERGVRASPKIGTANAARVSRGSAVDESMWTGVTNTEPKRDPNQHITVTVVLYNTVAGGVPSTEDVHAAIEDMERLYAACAWEGKLADNGAKGADFMIIMKSELTISEGDDIAEKVVKQPYTAPKGSLVNNASVFPRTAP
jgi:hypothetical protein